jgi:pimeloyl-ACP methyl ester carboxylesterase
MKNIILLHGALGNQQQLFELKTLLAEKYNVYSLNFSGHDGNDIQKPFSMQLFCDDVINFMKENEISNASFFGYSMGGYVALNLARFYPELVASIFTLGTVWDWSPERALKEVAMLDANKIEMKVPAFANELKERHAPADWKQVLVQTANMMTELGKNHLTEEDFVKINCPVKVGVGEHDKMVSVESALALSKMMPNGSFVVLPNTPHAIEQVDLQLLLKELENFL